MKQYYKANQKPYKRLSFQGHSAHKTRGSGVADPPTAARRLYVTVFQHVFGQESAQHPLAQVPIFTENGQHYQTKQACTVTTFPSTQSHDILPINIRLDANSVLYCSFFYSLLFRGMGGSPGDVSENSVTQEKRKKGWRMSCDVGEATESLENQNEL